MAIPKDHRQRQKWRDFQTLVVMTTERKVGDQETWVTRRYITNLPPQTKALADTVRWPWSIANSQHGVLDVAFGEDRRRQ